MWTGRIGDFGDCRVVVVVAGSIGPWRPGVEKLRMQDWSGQFSAFEARKRVVVSYESGTFEVLVQWARRVPRRVPGDACRAEIF